MAAPRAAVNTEFLILIAGLINNSKLCSIYETLGGGGGTAQIRGRRWRQAMMGGTRIRALRRAPIMAAWRRCGGMRVWRPRADGPASPSEPRNIFPVGPNRGMRFAEAWHDACAQAASNRESR